MRNVSNLIEKGYWLGYAVKDEEELEKAIARFVTIVKRDPKEFVSRTKWIRDRMLEICAEGDVNPLPLETHVWMR